MPYAVSNDGMTLQWHDPGENYSPQAGETLMTDISATSLAAAFPGYTSAAALQLAAQTSAVDLQAKIDAGITITSTGNTAISATYALDDETLTEIGSVARDSAAGMGLPGGSTTFAYPDIGRTNHSFTETEIQNCYKAMRDLMLQLEEQAAVEEAGGTPSWPSQSATIA